MPYLAATDMLAESGNSSYKNATAMFQLLVEEYTTLVNSVQNWQGRFHNKTAKTLRSLASSS